jgi:four helix bundle protein
MKDVNSKSYRNLVVWQKAKELVLKIYKVTKSFPKEELYILTSQIKRAAISVLSNIAEGNQRRTKKNRIYFFNIAQGSLIELGCQLEIAFELGFILKNDYKSTLIILNQTGYLLTRFIQSEINRSNLSHHSNLNNE